MPAFTAGRLADETEIGSYDDVIAAHHALCLKVAAGKGAIYADAAYRVARLGQLYRRPATITDLMRDAAEKALTAVHQALRTPQKVREEFAVADTWLGRLDLLVGAPADER